MYTTKYTTSMIKVWLRFELIWAFEVKHVYADLENILI